MDTPAILSTLGLTERNEPSILSEITNDLLAQILHWVDDSHTLILVCNRWFSMTNTRIAIRKHFCADHMNVGVYKLAPKIKKISAYGCNTSTRADTRQQIVTSDCGFQFLASCEVQTADLDARATVTINSTCFRVEVEAEFRSDRKDQLSILCEPGDHRYIFNNTPTRTPNARYLTKLFALPVTLKTTSSRISSITLDTLCNKLTAQQVKSLLTRESRETPF